MKPELKLKQRHLMNDIIHESGIRDEKAVGTSPRLPTMPLAAEMIPNAFELGEAETTRRQQNRSSWLYIPHLRKRRVAQREKQAIIEQQLPGIMQGASDLAEARKRMIIKNEIVAAVGEFVGTFSFLLLALGIATIAGQQNLTVKTKGQVVDAGGASAGGSLDASQLMYACLGFGLSLAVNAWIFFRVSGSLFNPAITLGLFLCGALTWYRESMLLNFQFRRVAHL